jgi:hypothetical protein
LRAAGLESEKGGGIGVAGGGLFSQRLQHGNPRPLLSELQVPEWQELAKDRQKWRKMLESIRTRR